MALPVAGLHLDLVRTPDQVDDVLKKAPKGLVLSLGIIDGRNIWRANLLNCSEADPLSPGEAPPDSNRAILFAASCPDRSRSGD